MMEKNGQVTLTEEEMKLYKEGKVSERLKEDWDLDFTSLDGMVKEGSVKLVNDKEDGETSGDK